MLIGASKDSLEAPTVTESSEAAKEQLESVVVGTTVEGRQIIAHRFGSGNQNLLFVGGIHGGYEPNTVVLAEEMITAFGTGAITVPENLIVHIIPNLNPDGYAKAFDPATNFTEGAKRFNSNNVDLNRNFNCRWSPEGVWRGAAVNAGTEPFSEPEAQALRDYVLEIRPTAAAFWHSRANNVYGSECGEGVSEETLLLMNTYAAAAEYGAIPVFDAYVVRGAAEDWLASLEIPTISVELETRTESEFERNLAGVQAMLQLYAN